MNKVLKGRIEVVNSGSTKLQTTEREQTAGHAAIRGNGGVGI